MLEWTPRTMQGPLLNPSLRQTCRGCFGHFSVSILLLQLEAGTQNMPNSWGLSIVVCRLFICHQFFFFGIWLCMWSSIVLIFFFLFQYLCQIQLSSFYGSLPSFIFSFFPQTYWRWYPPVSLVCCWQASRHNWLWILWKWNIYSSTSPGKKWSW